MNKPLSIKGFLLVIIAAGLLSCESERKERPATPKSVPKAVSVVSFSPKSNLTPRSTISVESVVAAGENPPTIDSVSATWRGQLLISSPSPNFEIDLKGFSAGRQEILTTVYLSDGSSEKHYLRITVLAPEAPVKYSFRKINTFTHDPDAYTQGLLVHDGFLYESTGQQGKSTLRKVDLQTGRVLQQVNLEDQYFGEGIALLNGQLFQLTYKSNVGFVYTVDAFQKTRTFNYPTEGWGLASLGNDLVMTDGSENLYFMDPESFTENRRVQAYTHEGKVDQLNELEVIDGKIYANVYQTDKIVIVDPETGFVEGEIDLTGILNREGYSRPLDVLNGIAWDANKKALYVTGKWWPKLFQIELVKISS